MRTTAHNTITALALAFALAFVTGSALAAAGTSSPSGYELAPRTDTRASFLVSWHDDERIEPRHILTDERGETVAP